MDISEGIGSPGNPQAKGPAPTYTRNRVNPNWPLLNLTLQGIDACIHWIVPLEYLKKKGRLPLLTNHNEVTGTRNSLYFA